MLPGIDEICRCEIFKGSVSRYFDWLQMILMNKTWVPYVPPERNEENSGTSGIHVLFIKIICSHPKSRDTIPLSSNKYEQHSMGSCATNSSFVLSIILKG